MCDFAVECRCLGVRVIFLGLKITVGMTAKIKSKVLLLELMLELIKGYGKVNNGHNNATIIRRIITWAFHWYS